MVVYVYLYLYVDVHLHVHFFAFCVRTHTHISSVPRYAFEVMNEGYVPSLTLKEFTWKNFNSETKKSEEIQKENAFGAEYDAFCKNRNPSADQIDKLADGSIAYRSKAMSPEKFTKRVVGEVNIMEEIYKNGPVVRAPTH